jgi:biopolymer transport protein ExbD
MFGLGRRMLGHQPEGINMPITPMLDMTFQLLFFFIVNYRPPDNEGEINYNLPAPDETAAASTIEEPKPGGDDELELKTNAELTVLVRTQHDGTNDGAISEVRVRENSGSETTVPTDNGKLDELIAFLKKRRDDSLLGNKDDIFIQGDSRLKWSGMVSVMDACRKAGFPNVGFKEPGDK